MREIKFRGRKINTDKWVVGNLGYTKTGGGNAGILVDGKLHIVDTETVGQYTGLKDKNGTGIYEGDIIRAGSEKATPWRIYWNDVRLTYYAQQTRDLFIKDPLWEMKTETFYEVIGNIYENPELLKEEEE